MRKKQVILTLLLSLVAGTACVGDTGPQLKSENIKAASQKIVGQCGSKPNCVSSAAFELPENEQPGWYIEPLGYDDRSVEGKRAFEQLVSILKAEKMALEIDYPKIHAVATTKLFGYEDDLSFILLEDQGIVHIRSESRKGYYDFGKNRRRLEAIRNEFIIGS